MRLNVISLLQITVIFGEIPEYGPVGQLSCKTGNYHFATSSYHGSRNAAVARCKHYDCDIIVEWTNKWNKKGYDIGRFNKAGVNKAGHKSKICSQNKDMTATVYWMNQLDDYMDSNNTQNGIIIFDITY